MATKIFRGDAPIVRQVDTLTPGGTIEVGDKFKVTINGKTVSYSATGTTVASVTAGLAAALEASTIPEFEEIAWTDGTTVVTATGPTDGTPVTISVSTTESDDSAADAQTFTKTAATTAASGENWNVAANWSPSGVPASSDDVTIDNFSGDIKHGLDQNAVTLASLNITASFTGTIGLAKVNTNAGTGSDSYYEYRDDYLKISATTVNIGLGAGAGSGRIKLNAGTAQCTLNVFKTGAPAETGLKSLLFKGTHASNAVRVSSGSVDVAPYAGETATVATLLVGYQTNQASDADVRAGSGVTLTTVTKTGGTLATQSAITTLTLGPDSGEHDHLDGAVTTVNGNGGSLLYRSTGTLSTAHIGSDFNLDFRRDPRARTVTTCNLQKGGIIHDPSETVTWTNGWVLPIGVGISDVTLDIGEGFTLTKS